MQDIWVGDDGDLLKLGLLRHLISRGGRLVGPLGVNWYYRSSAPSDDGERSSDPVLFDALADLRHAPRRTVAELERANLLHGAVYFRDLMPISGRRAARTEWHLRARAVLRACPTVFLDPDNGMEPDFPGLKSQTKSRLAHVLWTELHDYYRVDGKNVVVFQHASRRKDHERSLATTIQRALELAEPPMSVRSGNRWLYVVPQPGAKSAFEAMVEGLTPG